MKKKIHHILPFSLKILWLLCCWQVSYWAVADVMYTAQLEKFVTEDSNTLLIISYPLDNYKKINIKSVHLVVREEISGMELRSIKLLTEPKSIGEVKGDGHEKKITCKLKEQPPIPEGLYSAKIEYEEVLSKEEKRKKKKVEVSKKKAQKAITGINFLQQMITPWGHYEVNQIKITQSKESISFGQKLLQKVPLIISLGSFLVAGVQYSHAIDAANQNEETLRNQHLQKSYNALGVAGMSYVIDFLWVGTRNRKQKKARKKSTY